MKDATVLKAGIAGTVIAAVCCATPVLVVILGVLGLSAWIVWLDYVLLPGLVVCLGLTAYGHWRRKRRLGGRAMEDRAYGERI